MMEDAIIIKNADSDEFFARSNALIEASYKTNLTESKVIALALINSSIDEKTNQPVAELKMPYLKKELGLKGNSIYQTIKDLALQIISHKIMVESEKDGQKTFTVYYMVNKAHYVEKAGILKLYFDSEITPMLYDLKEKFTITPKTILMSFKSNHTYRLYELLSVKEYLLKKSGVDAVSVTYDLNELKMRLGMVNLDADNVSKIINKTSRPADIITDYNDKVDVLYKKWGDFKRWVLEVAKKELEESKTATFVFSYEPIRTGTGAKITAVKFLITKHPRLKNASDIAEIEVKNIFDDEPITKGDIRLLLKIANGDVERIREVYNMAKEQEQINNLIPWMRRAIEEDWKPNKIPKVKGKNYKESVEIVEQQEEYREYANSRLNNLPEIKPDDSIAIKKMILSLEDETLTEEERKSIISSIEIMRRLS